MKITEDDCKYAAEQAISDDDFLHRRKGMEEKSKEFLEAEAVFSSKV